MKNFALVKSFDIKNELNNIYLQYNTVDLDY